MVSGILRAGRRGGSTDLPLPGGLLGSRHAHGRRENIFSSGYFRSCQRRLPSDPGGPGSASRYLRPVFDRGVAQHVHPHPAGRSDLGFQLVRGGRTPEDSLPVEGRLPGGPGGSGPGNPGAEREKREGTTPHLSHEMQGERRDIPENRPGRHGFLRPEPHGIRRRAEVSPPLLPAGARARLRLRGRARPPGKPGGRTETPRGSLRRE